ncbi:MAG TPA: aminoglycoside phosphotransferase family protein [Devosia sp.]|jgi:Ser/Thr protein kinase RdoA (MazF antagonist)|nr:aminoglycoside phosphotransferase family protein [Devosia sp.]
MKPSTPSDATILSVLGAADAACLGAGGEACVYALPGQRVARIMRPGARLVDADARAALLGEIAGSAGTLSFRTPVVESVEVVEDRIVVLEERLPGEPVSKLLQALSGVARSQLLADFLETAIRIRQARISRPYIGPLIGDRSLRVARWSDFTRARVMANVHRCPADLRSAVLREASVVWAEPPAAKLVHLDYFPPNVLAEGDAVTAVLDFGISSVIGDPRMEAWSAVAYLDAEISPPARDEDRQQAMAWLAARGLAEDYPKARRWLAAAWSHAADDENLMSWCRRILLTSNGR